MDIPIIYGMVNDGTVCAGPVSYDGRNFSLTETVPLSSIDSLKPRKSRGTVVLADAGSLSSGRFVPQFVERCKVPGNDVWLIESVYDESDILDAFLPGLEKLVIPIHTVMDDSVLETAIDISGDCIPFIVCREGKALGRYRDPTERIGKLCAMGFGTVMVADLDGSIGEDVWHIMSDHCRTIPYCPCSRYPDTEDRAVDVFPFVSRRSLR